LVNLLIPDIRDINVEFLSRKEQKSLLLSIKLFISLGIEIKLIGDYDYDFVPNIKISGVTDVEDKSKFIRRITLLSKEYDRISILKKFINFDIIKNEIQELEYYYPNHLEQGKIKNPNTNSTNNNSGINIIGINNTNLVNSNKSKVDFFKGFGSNITKKNTRDEREGDKNYLFYIKFQEGMTNTVKRKLNFSYFLS